MIYACITGRTHVNGIEKISGYAYKLKDGWKIVSRYFQMPALEVWDLDNVKWYRTPFEAQDACLVDAEPTQEILLPEWMVL